MKELQRAREAAVAPHYYVIHRQCARLRQKLDTLMELPAIPTDGGWQFVEPLPALKMWERCLRRSAKKLSCRPGVFSCALGGRSGKMSYAQIQHSLIPVEQEINQLLALHNQLWQQPLPEKWHEGRLLLWSCIKKMSADLEKKCTFFINTLQASNDKEKQINQQCFSAAEISCKEEMAKYRKWWKSMRKLSILSRKKRWLSEILPGFSARLQAENSFFCRA